MTVVGVASWDWVKRLDPDLIGSSGIENATSAQPKNLASAPRLSPLRSFGGVAGDETTQNPK